jgi:hypothetical protein
MVTVIAAASIALWGADLQVLFPSSGIPSKKVAQIASRNAEAYGVLLGALDPKRGDFQSATPDQVVAAVRKAFGKKLPRLMMIDLDPKTVSAKVTVTAGAQPSGDQSVVGARMADLVRALKTAFPATKWAWRGIPTCTAPGSTSWSDSQYQALASAIDWMCPANIVDTSEARGVTVTGANATNAARAWAPSRPVIAAISQWGVSGTSATASSSMMSLITNRALLDGPVAAARTAGTDGIMFIRPKTMTTAQAVQTVTSLQAAIVAIRAQPLLAAPATNAGSAPPSAPPSVPTGTVIASTATQPNSQIGGTTTPTSGTTTPTSGTTTPTSGTTSPGTAASPATPALSMSNPISIETARSSEIALAAIPTRLLQPYSGSLSLKSTNWSSVYERSFDSPTLRAMLVQLNRMAELAYGQPSNRYIRPMVFDQIPTDMLCVPYLNIQPVERRDLNQLANVDTIQTQFLRTQGVTLAIVANRTRNPDYIRRCIEMLEAVNQYRPLQRPGYTYGDESVPMRPDGDGVWLATAWGIDAIIEMLNALGNDVPAELRSRLEMQVRDEVQRIAKDWADKRPWFVQSRKAQSNQWIEPSVALVKACLFLGDRDLLPAYELGAENIEAALSKLGADGSFNEGLGYAEMSAGRLLDITRIMRESGDTRVSSGAFARKSWAWFVQMHMPGGMLVNCFDGAKSWLPEGGAFMPMASLGAAALVTEDVDAIPTLKYLFPQLRGNYSLEAIEFAAALAARPEPARLAIETFAHFPDQQLLVWRSEFQVPSQAQTAWALWLRGGSATNVHCHRDQGHISVCIGGQPVLLEAGSSEYGTAEYNNYFCTAAGHSTMQIEPLQPFGQPVNAPISVGVLDANGGSAAIDCTAAFPAASQYVRNFRWDRSGRISINDALVLRQPTSANSELFRYHTGSETPVTITGSGTTWTASWAGATMTFTSSVPIQVAQLSLADSVTRSGRHQVISIQATSAIDRVNLEAVLGLELAGGQ